MYWPVGTPRIYATSTSHGSNSNLNLVVSHDGLQSPGEQQDARSEKSPFLSPDAGSGRDALGLPTTPTTPMTPATPLTPDIRSVEHDYHDERSPSPQVSSATATATIPLKEPILALRVARPGHIFAVITATSMTIWQTKVFHSPDWSIVINAYLY